MISRPKPGETEDDLLKMQEEFLKEKSQNTNYQPAAQVVNLRRTEHQTTKRTISNETTSRKPSKYAVSKGLPGNIEKRPRTEASTSTFMGEIVEKNCESVDDKSVEIDDDKVYYPKALPSILGTIIEKNSDKQIDFHCNDQIPSEGFPAVIKLDPSITPGRKSIHAQHLEKLGGIKKMKMDVDEPHSNKSSLINQQPSPKPLNLPNKSFIISSKDADSIHNENNETLRRMSEKEIVEEQQKILSNLDPKLIEYIKTKRQQTTSKEEPQSVTSSKSTDSSKPCTEEVKTINNEEKELNDQYIQDNDILSNPNVNKWVHFDQLEKDKLEWMKAISESKEDKPEELYEARFDFRGLLLPYTSKYTEMTKTLYHHGEEPHRPGYSIIELIELSRSTIIQQRVMALNTIAGILEFYIAGTYKDTLELPITKLFFIIRIAMDENKTIILEPALNAMRNLLYNKIDEAALDALIGFEEGSYQPCLENDKSEIVELESKESEFKDFHLAEIDLIAALLRTDILQRIYYILDMIKPNFNCVQFSLQILIRLCRDSESTVNKIIEMDHLMSVIVTNFIPKTSINFNFDPNIVYKGKPILSALKFLRVLTLQTKEIGDTMIIKYGILQPLSEYICSKVDGTYGFKIQIEALSILSNLLHYGLGLESCLAVCPTVITMLYNHVQGTDVDMKSSIISASHAAVVLQFINKLLQCNLNLDSYKHQIYPLLREGVKKWISQVSSFTCGQSFTCGHLRFVCSILDCCATVMKNENQTMPFLNITLENLMKSPGFKGIINHLVLSSNLLSGIENNSFHTIKNLVNLNSIVNGSTQSNLPILNMKSPIPFLTSLFKLLAIINDINISNGFIEHILKYLRKFANIRPTLCDNWFTRMETDFLFYIIKIATQCNFAESEKDLLYTVANKLCYILRADKKMELEFLFDNIIFNKQWFSSERLFSLLSLSEKDGVTKVLTDANDIKSCYSSVINLNYSNSNLNVVLKKWKEPILPRDWIYLPILTLYGNSQEVKSTPKVAGEHASKVAEQEAKTKELILNSSLEWILFNEMCFPDLLKEIDVTDRFCRIMCVFLCDNSLFLEPSIKLLLRKCTEVLFKSGNKFNFDKDLTGLNNFQDFYMQFLEHFQGVSYGDPCFAACVLVPLAQRHNVKWRKMLWSEYAGCLRALDCPDDYLCYELNDYLYPEENDESLLKCYFRALNSNLMRRGTIVYRIAEHHVNNFKLRKTSNE
ncbi:RNA polymerase II-associated protein 1 [Papilio xuthus]|uniref:RNA polymerase II-associated protein 1 n=1 Tax=Papilio xuthus TaxID=66420 RepID=A0A194Q0V0_PAPXU|nr:RNA polymerase II-associated protein 1 [Papilio xuthus]